MISSPQTSGQTAKHETRNLPQTMKFLQAPGGRRATIEVVARMRPGASDHSPEADQQQDQGREQGIAGRRPADGARRSVAAVAATEAGIAETAVGR